ncbi:MAG: hypothetical protein KC496_06340 [Anaerolineae bacterium]|nr:hypothetical protein [Anaerolineae bacterium]
MNISVFYSVDVLSSIGIVASILMLWLMGRLSTTLLRLFVVGCLIGTLWEFPLHFLGPEYSDNPIYIQLTEFPLLPILQPALHCLWDGAIFLVGIGLVWRPTPAPHFSRFRWDELAVLMLWGLGSAIVVELVGSMGGWIYVESWWNPALFWVNSGAITLLPLMIWLVAPMVFYGAVLWLNKSFGSL